MNSLLLAARAETSCLLKQAYFRSLLRHSSSTSSSSSGPKPPSTAEEEREKEERKAKLKEKLELIKNNPDRLVHWEYHQDFSTAKIYDKKPVKIEAIKGKIYMYCACGNSRNQPFCDGTHRLSHYQIKIKPIPWTCRQSGEYFLCNCKQAKLRPFCDGTHLEDRVKNEMHTTIKT